MNITTLFGLPAHPLLVHAPIVLIPLCGLGVIAMALHRGTLHRIGVVVAGLTVVAGISTQLAISSGQGLRESVRESAALERHVAIAESIRPLVLLLFFAALALLWLDRRERLAGADDAAATPAAPTRPGALRIALGAVAIVVAIGTNVRLAQIGHSGAQATWDRVKVVSTKER